jgi:hypothetical protein
VGIVVAFAVGILGLLVTLLVFLGVGIVWSTFHGAVKRAERRRRIRDRHAWSQRLGARRLSDLEKVGGDFDSVVAWRRQAGSAAEGMPLVLVVLCFAIVPLLCIFVALAAAGIAQRIWIDVSRWVRSIIARHRIWRIVKKAIDDEAIWRSIRRDREVADAVRRCVQ